MKKGKIKLIRIPVGKYGDVQTISAKYLGKGEFSICYTADGWVYSFLEYGEIENDYSKMAISQRADKNSHIPDFENLGKIGRYAIFKSPLYQPLTPQNKIAWNQAKILKKVWEKSGNYYINRCDCYTANQDLIADCAGLLPDDLIDALQSINDALANFGYTYRFEFPRRNLAVDEQGNLILLDVIFNTHATKSFQNS